MSSTAGELSCSPCRHRRGPSTAAVPLIEVVSALRTLGHCAGVLAVNRDVGHLLKCCYNSLLVVVAAVLSLTSLFSGVTRVFTLRGVEESPHVLGVCCTSGLVHAGCVCCQEDMPGNLGLAGGSWEDPPVDGDGKDWNVSKFQERSLPSRRRAASCTLPQTGDALSSPPRLGGRRVCCGFRVYRKTKPEKLFVCQLATNLSSLVRGNLSHFYSVLAFDVKPLCFRPKRILGVGWRTTGSAFF